jgi:heptose I phosphotransferase
LLKSAEPDVHEKLAMKTEISADFIPVWEAEGGFDGMFALQGEVYRRAPGRRTLRFAHGGRSYFVKLHSGVGWAEIFKNLFTLRLPVLGATNEFEAIRRMRAAGLAAPRPVAYAREGTNPATRRSLIVTEDLGDSISLETLCAAWPQHPPAIGEKRALIAEVARISRRMHEDGINHRDFYLCHFLRSYTDGRLYVIDLHRAQLRRRVPRRWLVKDLGGLYFSAMDIGLTRRDLYRFLRAYTGRPLRETLRDPFWAEVRRRADSLHGSYHAK